MSPACPYYAWAKSADEPGTYVVIEVYRDAATHAAHMASPWVTESLPRSIALVDGGFDIQQYVSEGSEPVGAAAQGLNYSGSCAKSVSAASRKPRQTRTA